MVSLALQRSLPAASRPALHLRATNSSSRNQSTFETEAWRSGRVHAGGYSLRGGMAIRSSLIRTGDVVMGLITMTMPDGKIEQYIVSRAG